MSSTSRQRSRVRQWSTNLVAFVVSFALGVIGLEMALRLFFYGDLKQPNYSVEFVEPHPTRGWANRAGVRGIHQELDFRVRVRINDRGVRGGDFAPQPQPGRQRILLLGDSAMFGSGVGDQDCLASQLQALLGPGVEVINLGALAYSSVQELQWLRDSGLGLKPDLVVLAFAAINDIQTNVVELQRLYQRTLRRPYASLGPDGKLKIDTAAASEGERRSGAKASRGFFINTAVFRVGRLLFRKLANAEVVDPNIYLGWPLLVDFVPQHAQNGLGGEDYQRLWRDGWQVTAALIETMAAETRSAGAGFAMFNTTAKVQADPQHRRRVEQAFPGARIDPLKMDRELQALGTRLGIPVLDITTPLLAAATKGGQPLYYDIEDEHWTPRGNRLAAEALASELRRAKLVK